MVFPRFSFPHTQTGHVSGSAKWVTIPDDFLSPVTLGETFVTVAAASREDRGADSDQVQRVRFTDERSEVLRHGHVVRPIASHSLISQIMVLSKLFQKDLLPPQSIQSVTTVPGITAGTP